MAKVRIDFKSPKKLLFPLNIITFNLCRLIPFRDKHLWIFGAWEGRKFDDNSRALMEYVVKNHGTDIRCVWLTKDQKTIDLVRSLGYEAYQFDTLTAKWLQIRAKVAVYTNGLMDFGLLPLVGGAEVVSLWHGVGFKKIYNAKLSGIKLIIKRFIDIFYQWTYRTCTLTTSEYTKWQFSQICRLKEREVYITGQPRNDSFKTIIRDVVLSSAGLNPTRKVYAYMPTYRQPAMGVNAMADIVTELYRSESLMEILNRNNATFVCKLHPLTPHIDLPQREDFVILDYSAVKNNQEFIGACDVMISDYSSVVTDFALLERPILSYMPDEEKFSADSEDMFSEFDGISNIVKATNPTELAELLKLPSMALLNAINDLFEDKSIKGTCYCENAYNVIRNKIGI